MLNKLYRLMRFVRLFMWLLVPTFSIVSYMFHQFIQRVNDLKLLNLFEQLQSGLLFLLKIVVLFLVVYYTLRLLFFLLQYQKNKQHLKIKRRLHLIKNVFEGIKLPEEKQPKYTYQIQGVFLILTIYKNFYVELKMITDHIDKFEQVFNLQAIKIEEVAFDKILVYFVLENKVLHLEDFDINLKSNELCVGQSLHKNLILDLNLTPHLLIAGSNGSGKTSFMRFLYFQFKIQQDKGLAEIVLFDGKGIEFTQYQKECLVVYENYLHELEKLHTSMKNKYIDMREKGQKMVSSEDKRTIILIDEYTSILDNMNKQEKLSFEQKAGDIARLGRSAGFDLIIGLQRADAKIVQGEIKENMTKVLLGSSSDEAKRIMFATTDVMNQKRGSGTIQIDDTLFVFEFPYIS